MILAYMNARLAMEKGSENKNMIDLISFLLGALLGAGLAWIGATLLLMRYNKI